MKKIALIFVTVATLATALASPVEARGWRGGGWGWGPGIGLGIAAGALAAARTAPMGPMDLTAMVLATTATTARDMHTTDRASIGRATITDGS
jgi:hypothetical protein